eukprot:1834474-Prymnesium_polylepis.1
MAALMPIAEAPTAAVACAHTTAARSGDSECSASAGAVGTQRTAAGAGTGAQGSGTATDLDCAHAGAPRLASPRVALVAGPRGRRPHLSRIMTWRARCSVASADGRRREMFLASRRVSRRCIAAAISVRAAAITRAVCRSSSRRVARPRQRA